MQEKVDTWGKGRKKKREEEEEKEVESEYSEYSDTYIINNTDAQTKKKEEEKRQKTNPWGVPGHYPTTLLSRCWNPDPCLEPTHRKWVKRVCLQFKHNIHSTKSVE